MDHEMYHSTQFIIDYDTVVNSRKCGLVVDWNGLQAWITNVKLLRIIVQQSCNGSQSKCGSLNALDHGIDHSTNK